MHNITLEEGFVMPKPSNPHSNPRFVAESEKCSNGSSGFRVYCTHIRPYPRPRLASAAWVGHSKGQAVARLGNRSSRELCKAATSRWCVIPRWRISSIIRLCCSPRWEPPRGRVERASRETSSSYRTQSVGSLDTLDWGGDQEEML